MASLKDYPETPLINQTAINEADEDKALVQIVNIGVRRNATADEIAGIVEILGLGEALERLRKDVEIREDRN